MGLSFLRGLVAAVNPCAFVLLPTYLLYFLGLENPGNGDQKASVRRALTVSVAVSAGFMSVFVVIGVISEYVTSWIIDEARFATLVIGLAFVVLGSAMFMGYKLPISAPHLKSTKRDRTMSSMYVYGMAYGVTSIGCTLPLFASTLFGNVASSGWGSGVANVVAYGAGMALVVTSLTVALAAANRTLLGLLRRGTKRVDRATAVLVLLSGLYLLYYFWIVDVNEDYSAVTDAVGRLQREIQTRLNNHWEVVAVVLGLVVASAVAYVSSSRRSVGNSQ